MRIEIKKSQALKEKEEVVGNHGIAKVVKNKVAPPFKTAEFDIMYGEGVSREGLIIDMGVDAGYINKSGAWFSYNDAKLGQGKENSRTYLKENPAIAQELEDKIRAKYATADMKPAAVSEED